MHALMQKRFLACFVAIIFPNIFNVIKLFVFLILQIFWSDKYFFLKLNYPKS